MSRIGAPEVVEQIADPAFLGIGLRGDRVFA